MGARTKSLLLILFTLFTGIGIGLWAGGRLFEQRVERIRELGSADGLQRFMQNELNLNPEQDAEIQQILQEHMPRMRAIYTDFFEQRQKEADALDAAIMPLLDPAQQAKWEAHKQRMKERGRRKRPGGPSNQGRPPSH